MSVLKKLLLGPPRLTLAVAESVTCGHLQAAIGSISGASEFFLGGITAYTLEQKVRHLGVDRAEAAAVDCVSAEIAAQMAAGTCRLFGSDLAMATTGYAELPNPGVPFLWWALHDATRPPISGKLEFPGLSRVEVQRRGAETVLLLFEAYLHVRNR